MRKIVKQSGSTIYNSDLQTFQSEIQRWKKLLPDKKIVTINYIKSNPQMDFVIDDFKMIICLQDTQFNFETTLIDLSRKNKNKRVWK